jgi:DNA-binding LacI/PurR family transcriptional regulator
MSFPNKLSSSRKTIGVFASQVGRSWGAEFITGINEAAVKHNVNLVHFIGGKLIPIPTSDTNKSSYGLYDLAKPDQLDGLLLTADVAYGTNPADLKTFFDSYGNLPIVTQSVEFDRASMFIPNNTEGMRSAVRHLIEEHA